MSRLGSGWRLEVAVWAALVGVVWWTALHVDFVSWGSVLMAPLWAGTIVWHRYRSRRAVAEAYVLGWRGRLHECVRGKQPTDASVRAGSR